MGIRSPEIRVPYTDGAYITKPQWKALQLLGPAWMLVRRGFCHHGTRTSMLKHGWIEIKDREKYFVVRLTKAGLEVRNKMMIGLAQRKSRNNWYSERVPAND